MSLFLSFGSIMTYVGYIIVAILVLLAMVTIHEFGHYVAGKILKFKIDEFSVGFGPKILQKTKKNGEKISLRAFPLGGYCAFEGEGENNQNPQAFNNQKPWKRLIVLFSGAFFNLLSAIIFSFILLVSVGYDYAKVDTVTSSSINYNILQTNDVIVGVNGQDVDFVHDQYINTMIIDTLTEKYINVDTSACEYSFTKDDKTYFMTKRDITFKVRRDGEKITVDAYVNVIYNSDGEYAGWTLLSTEKDSDEFSISTYKYSFGESLLQAVPFTFKWAWKILIIFGRLLAGKLDITTLGGPVTTITMIANYTRTSVSYLILLLPVIAVNLAVFNWLPIPALDGFKCYSQQ